jgi:hypothetical protein
MSITVEEIRQSHRALWRGKDWFADVAPLIEAQPIGGGIRLPSGGALFVTESFSPRRGEFEYEVWEMVSSGDMPGEIILRATHRTLDEAEASMARLANGGTDA